MSTTALVGYATSELSYTAIHVEYDGYPSHIGPFLQKIIARDGVRDALLKLTSHTDWSGFDAAQSEVASRRGRYVVVPGYGEVYPPEDYPSAELISKSFGDSIGENWGYVFSVPSLAQEEMSWGELRVLNGSGQTVATIPLEVLELIPDRHWEAIQEGRNADGWIPGWLRIARDRAVPPRV